MYDTVFLCLTQADVSGVDFLKVAPRFLVLVCVADAQLCCRLHATGAMRYRKHQRDKAGLVSLFFFVVEDFSNKHVIFAVPK